MYRLCVTMSACSAVNVMIVFVTLLSAIIQFTTIFVILTPALAVQRGSLIHGRGGRLGLCV